MNIFEFIKTHVHIADVVQEYVTLKRAGLYLKGRCPFHDEKTASFTVSPHREIFYCFGCHKGGDVVTFVSEIERCTVLEAAHQLAERYNLEIPRTMSNKNMPDTDGKNMYQHVGACELFARWCHEQLLSDAHARDYFAKRGIVESTMRNFTLGYFPEKGIDSLLVRARSDGFLAQDLIDASVIAEGKFGLYSSFAERLIFPIKDHLGRVCGFGGRIFRQDDQRPKYYNSPDHDFFVKGRMLFGLDRAKKSMQEKQEAFLVEGYTDCIAMVQAGHINTVASLGTACTPEQCKMLARYVCSLNLMYDGDTAGQEAMVRMAHMLWSADMEPYVIVLPASEDPASFLQENINIDGLLSQRQDIFLFYMNRIGADYHTKTLQERVRLVRDLLAIIAALHDPLKQNVLLQKAAVTFGIPMQTLVESIGKSALRTEYRRDNEPAVVPPHTCLEDLIFVSLINGKITLDVDDEDFLKSVCSGLTRLLIEKFLIYNKTNTSNVNLNAFLEHLSIEEKRLAAHIIIEYGDVQENVGDIALKLLRKREWKKRVRDITARLKKAEEEGSHDSFAQISQEFNILKAKMKEKGVL